MNEKSSKLRHEQKHEQEHGLEQTQQQGQQLGSKEFNSVEEMIRHDSADIVVPPAIAARLNQSLANEPKQEKSWWRRFFGKE